MNDEQRKAMFAKQGSKGHGISYGIRAKSDISTIKVKNNIDSSNTCSVCGNKKSSRDPYCESCMKLPSYTEGLTFKDGITQKDIAKTPIVIGDYISTKGSSQNGRIGKIIGFEVNGDDPEFNFAKVVMTYGDIQNIRMSDMRKVPVNGRTMDIIDEAIKRQEKLKTDDDKKYLGKYVKFRLGDKPIYYEGRVVDTQRRGGATFSGIHDALYIVVQGLDKNTKSSGKFYIKPEAIKIIN